MEKYNLTDLTLPKHQFDIILKGGRVIDPELGLDDILDVAIADDKIAAVAKDIQSVCYNIVDCTGKIVIPGIVDSHVHCYPSTHMSMTPETAGIYSGVPTVVDGGSTGYMTFPDFYNRYITRSATDVYAFMHFHPVGQYAHGSGHHVHPELWDSRLFKMQYYRVQETVDQYRDRILGMKNRAIDSFIEYKGLAGLDEQLEWCEKMNLPYAIHIGEAHGEHLSDDVIDEFTKGLLERLRPGDIITHAFTHKRGCIFREDGKFDDLVDKAVKRGVLLDACTGKTNVGVAQMRMALARGFKPDILSSDFTWLSVQGVNRHFALTMSRFMACGLSLNDVVAMSTCKPAKAIGLADRKGNLTEGRVADISVLDVYKGEYTFMDHGGGTEFTGPELLSAALTVRAGRLYYVIHNGDVTP